MRFSVEQGHALTFARVIGETPPGPGDVVPPTFTACTSQHDPAHMLAMEPAGAVASLMASAATVLHAEQHFEYLAPVTVGATFEVDERMGRTWTKQGSGGSRLTFTELIKELTDSSGTVVLRSRMVLVTL